jgi:hypothetical protein
MCCGEVTPLEHALAEGKRNRCQAIRDAELLEDVWVWLRMVAGLTCSRSARARFVAPEAISRRISPSRLVSRFLGDSLQHSPVTGSRVVESDLRMSVRQLQKERRLLLDGQELDINYRLALNRVRRHLLSESSSCICNSSLIGPSPPSAGGPPGPARASSLNPRPAVRLLQSEP